jgi:hypothetical protein
MQREFSPVIVLCFVGVHPTSPNWLFRITEPVIKSLTAERETAMMCLLNTGLIKTDFGLNKLSLLDQIFKRPEDL